MFLTAREVQSIADFFYFLAPNSNFYTTKIRKISVRRFFLPQKLL